MEAHAALATVHHRFGQRADAVRHYERALELVRNTGDRYPEVDVLIGLAVVTTDPGPAEQALVLAERAGYRALQGQAITALARILLASGRARESAEHARRALAIHRETGHRQADAVAVLERATSPSR